MEFGDCDEEAMGPVGRGGEVGEGEGKDMGFAPLGRGSGWIGFARVLGGWGSSENRVVLLRDALSFGRVVCASGMACCGSGMDGSVSEMAAT